MIGNVSHLCMQIIIGVQTYLGPTKIHINSKEQSKHISIKDFKTINCALKTLIINLLVSFIIAETNLSICVPVSPTTTHLKEITFQQQGLADISLLGPECDHASNGGKDVKASRIKPLRQAQGKQKETT